MKTQFQNIFTIIYGLFKGLVIALKNEELRTILLMAIFVLLSGTVFYHYVENLSFLDAFYFTSITVATVGYGDFTPQTDVGKIFTVVYIFMGIGLIASFIQKFSATVISYQAAEVQKRQEHLKRERVD